MVSELDTASYENGLRKSSLEDFCVCEYLSVEITSKYSCLMIPFGEKAIIVHFLLSAW